MTHRAIAGVREKRFGASLRTSKKHLPIERFEAMTNAISAIGSNATSATESQNTGAEAAKQSQQMFLQLLVAQLQNQDPLNPADGMTFVSQLAQFSQVESLLGIRKDLG